MCLHFIFNNSSEYRYQISKLKNSIPVTSARYFDPRPESGAALGTDHTFTQRIYVSTIYTVTRYSTIYQHPVTPDNGHHGWVSRYTFFQVKWPCDFISLPGLPPPLQAKVESTPRVGMTMPWWGNSLWMSWKWLLGGELSRHRLIARAWVSLLYLSRLFDAEGEGFIRVLTFRVNNWQWKKIDIDNLWQNMPSVFIAGYFKRNWWGFLRGGVGWNHWRGSCYFKIPLNIFT